MDGFVVVDAPTGGYLLTRLGGLRGTNAAWFSDETLAVRAATLLNREGLVDAPLPELDTPVA